MVLDDKIDAGLTTSLLASDLGSAAAWGSKRIRIRVKDFIVSAPVLFVSDLEWIPFQNNIDDDEMQIQFATYLV